MAHGSMGKFASAIGLAVVLVAVLVPSTTRAAASEDRLSYAVLPFENRSGIPSMRWMRVALPFVLAEKLEAHPRLRPVYGTLVVPDGAPPAAIDAAAVAAFAAKAHVQLVWTGWVRRAASWDLVAGVTLWRVRDGVAERVGESSHRGAFKTVQQMLNESLRTLCEQGGFPLRDPFATQVMRVATQDYYAFTLFGRGLLRMHGLGRRPHLAKALATLSRAVFIDPKLAAAHRLIAVVQLWKGRPAKARGQFGYALALRSDYYAALAGRGRVLYAEGKVESAKQAFERMLALRPWDVELRYDVGKLYWENGDAAEAQAALSAVVDADPNNLAARRLLVLIHASRGDTADLVRQLEIVAELDPDDLATRLDLGAAYAAVGREGDAIRIYESVVTQRPRHLQALKLLGDLHRRRGELDEAIASYERARAAHPSDPRPYFLLAGAYVDAGDDARARRVYLRALRFKRYLPQTYNNLGSIAYRQRKFGEARWYLARAVRWRPDNPRFRYNLALVYSVLRKLDRAREHVERGIALAPDDASLHYLRGVIMLRIGDADAAAGEFRRTLALDANHADARHNLALLEQMQRRAVEGEITIELPQPGR